VGLKPLKYRLIALLLCLGPNQCHDVTARKLALVVAEALPYQTLETITGTRILDCPFRHRQSEATAVQSVWSAKKREVLVSAPDTVFKDRLILDSRQQTLVFGKTPGDTAGVRRRGAYGLWHVAHSVPYVPRGCACVREIHGSAFVLHYWVEKDVS
jgi:hypothetical protein